MKGYFLTPACKVSEFVQSILVIENFQVIDPFVLPLFANGKPTLLFQTAKGQIKSDRNHLTLFGQTILPDALTLKENFILIAYFFKPYTLQGLFGISPRELTDKPIDLTLVSSTTTHTLQEKLLNTSSIEKMIDVLDNYIFGLISKMSMDVRMIKYATELISGNPAKDILVKVQKTLCITERTFQRHFENVIGISPNQYRRVAQFDSAFQQINSRQFIQLTDIAFQHNYADQSHYIRAFKEFTNLTPREYLNFADPG